MGRTPAFSIRHGGGGTMGKPGVSGKACSGFGPQHPKEKEAVRGKGKFGILRYSSGSGRD